MKKRLKHFSIIALILILLALSSSCGKESDIIRLPNNVEYYSHDETLEVTTYPDVTATYETVEMYVSDIELRGNALTLSFYISQIESIEETFYGAENKGAIEIALDSEFEDTLEYKGMVQLEDEAKDVYLYALTPAQVNEANTLYMRFPVVWKVLSFGPLSADFCSYSELPDTHNIDYNADGIFEGDLSGFVVHYKDKDLFAVTQIKRWKGKDEEKQNRYFLTMEIESLGANEYLPGTIYLHSNSSNSKFVSIYTSFDDPLTFAKGTKGTLIFEVAKSTYKQFDDCQFFIRDISSSEVCETVATINAQHPGQ